MARKDLRNVTMKIKDGTGTPQEITVKLGTGNATWSESYPREYEAERGNIANGTVRDGDQEAVELSVVCTWEFILASTGGTETPYEALNQVGEAAAWVTTGGDACEPYAVDIEFFHDVGCDPTEDETITFPEFRVEQCDFDFQAGTLSFSGKCKAVRPTVTRDTP